MRSIRRCLRARVESVDRYLAAGRQQKVVTLSFPRDLADRSARIRCRSPPTNHQLLWSSGYDMSLISYQDVTLRITSVRNLRVLGSTPSGSKSFFFFFIISLSKQHVYGELYFISIVDQLECIVLCCFRRHIWFLSNYKLQSKIFKSEMSYMQPKA